MIKLLNVDKNKAKVAVVGATGSVGSISSLLLTRMGINELLLVDLERKKELFSDLLKKIKDINPNIKIKISHKIVDIKEYDFIITATNAPEALIKKSDLKSGAIIIDDAQPSDVSRDVFDRDDVLVLEAGAVFTPNINNHFDFGLKGKFDNFCCMAELLILAHLKHNGNYVINRANLEEVDYVSKVGQKLGFRLSKLQNFKEVISEEKINKIKSIVNKNY